MAVSGEGERQSLGINKKSYGKSYGSLQKSKQEIYIKHIVSESDTLQGIALKYGISIEQIRRANKLFTTDSIFLRKVLNIPVGDQPLPSHLLETATASLSSENGTNCKSDRTPIIQRTKDDTDSEDEADAAKVEVEIKKESREMKQAASPVKTHSEHHDEPRDETMDFFNRIDRQVRSMKTEVQRIEENSSIKELESKLPPSPNRAGHYDYKTKCTPAYQGDSLPKTKYSPASTTITSTGSPKIFAKAKKLFGGKEGGGKKLMKADSQAEELLQEDQQGFYEL
ncbi:lysM and putative peptidoglycan-binding domain-containing protein 1-like [Glandiceps talaboti]